MLRKNQFHIGLSDFSDSGAVGMDYHAFTDNVITRGNEFIYAFHFHNTNTAGANFVDIFQITQARHMNAGSSCRFQNGGIFFYLYLFSIYGQIYHLSTLPPLKLP